MSELPLLLSDAEIDDLCAPLKRASAQARFLRQCGITVYLKPNGRAAVVRSHAEVVLSTPQVETASGPVGTSDNQHSSPDGAELRRRGRNRAGARADWPRGLYEPRPGYYVWRDPNTGKARAIGRVLLSDAQLQAIEANLWIKTQLRTLRLKDKLQGSDGLTVSKWLRVWLKRLRAAGDLAGNTVKSYSSSVNAVAAEALGDVPLPRTTVRDVAEALEKIRESRGARTAQACRAVLKTAFVAAMAAGHMTTNPAAVTAAVKVKVQRERFTWETFSLVWAELQKPEWPAWLRNAAALGLVTGQRREDIAAAKFNDFDADVWRLVQGKTKRRLAIPMDLRLDALGKSLREVVADCRHTRIRSKHLIHQVHPHGNSPVGAAIFKDTLSRRFSDAVAAALGRGQNRPTFHELRSLCKRLYLAQGGVDTRALLGHSTERMEDLYSDARGAEFVRVGVVRPVTQHYLSGSTLRSVDV